MLTGLLVFVVCVGLAIAVGYGVLCGLVAPSRSGNQPSFELCELVFVLVLLGTLVVGWVAVTLLQIGWFSAPRTMLLAFAVSALFGLVGVLRCGSLWRPQVHFGRFMWLLAGLVAAAVVLFFHPAEFVIGGGDAGVYVNLGSVWARTGSFVLSEETLSELPVALLPGLFRTTTGGHVAEAIRLPGFYLSSQEQGLVVPQFFPLHPVWMALINGFAGTEASLYATSFWAVLGVVSLTLTARRLFGDRTGALSGALLLIAPLQIYFARYPTAEPLTQALVWAGLYAFVRFQEDRENCWGVAAGLAIGQVFLARIDAIPVLIIPAILIVRTLRSGEWRRASWFLVPFMALFLQAVYQSLVLSYPYTWEIFGSLIPTGLRLLRQYGLVIVVLGGLGAIGCQRLLRRTKEPRYRLGSLIRWGGAAALLAAAVYAYFVWPVVGQTVLVPYWYGGSNIPVMNHLNMVRLAWYLTPLGIWLGVAGVIGVILTESWNRTWSVLCVGLSFTILYLYNILNNPYHVYAMRRYVPVVVPFLVLAMAYALVRLWELRARWRAAGWLAVVCALSLIAWLGYRGRAVWTLVEYEGLQSHLRDVAERLEPGAVLLFDDAPPVGIGSTIGTPLQYIYGFTSYDLQEEQLSMVDLERAVVDWVTQGKTVYWVVGSSPVLGPPQSLSPEPILGEWLETTLLEQSYYEFPDERVPYRVALEFYKLRPEAAERPCTFATHIDVGTLDTTSVVSGFYDKELLGSRSVRWTDGDAVAVLPCLPENTTSTAVVDITLAASRPVGMALPVVEVSVGNEVLRKIALGDDFTTISFEVPVGELGSHGIRIVSDTWVPREHGVGLDDRLLGVLIDDITINASVDGH